MRHVSRSSKDVAPIRSVCVSGHREALHATCTLHGRSTAAGDSTQCHGLDGGAHNPTGRQTRLATPALLNGRLGKYCVQILAMICASFSWFSLLSMLEIKCSYSCVEPRAGVEKSTTHRGDSNNRF